MARIAITGTSGLIGGGLAESLEADGHTVHRVVRSSSRAREHDVVWNLDDRTIDADKLEGVDAVVHLAGEPIGASRWTEQTKHRIRVSREVGTELIAETLAGLDDPPAVLVSGSAVGYYGDRGDEVLTESAAPGDDFMARLCVAWEAAADPAREAGIRVVHNRTGVVLARQGPLIEKVELPFKLGVGGKVGSGRQYVPWISYDDIIRGLRFLIDREDLEGPVNLVAPEPVTNAELTRALGAAMRRPTIFPIPILAIRLLYGEMGESLAAVSQRVVPETLLAAGFEFTYSDVRSALTAALAERRAA